MGGRRRRRRFYTERIAKEGFLRTATAAALGPRACPDARLRAATRRRRPGRPRVHRRDRAGRAGCRSTVPAARRCSPCRDRAQLPQTFETGEALEARGAWNALPVARTHGRRPSAGRRRAGSGVRGEPSVRCDRRRRGPASSPDALDESSRVVAQSSRRPSPAQISPGWIVDLDSGSGATGISSRADTTSTCSPSGSACGSSAGTHQTPTAWSPTGECRPVRIRRDRLEPGSAHLRSGSTTRSAEPAGAGRRPAGVLVPDSWLVLEGVDAPQAASVVAVTPGGATRYAISGPADDRHRRRARRLRHGRAPAIWCSTPSRRRCRTAQEPDDSPIAARIARCPADRPAAARRAPGHPRAAPSPRREQAETAFAVIDVRGRRRRRRHPDAGPRRPGVLPSGPRRQGQRRRRHPRRERRSRCSAARTDVPPSPRSARAAPR